MRKNAARIKIVNRRAKIVLMYRGKKIYQDKDFVGIQAFLNGWNSVHNGQEQNV